MAGHSKWANIKHRKAATDAKRSKVWTKVLREVTVSVKLGGEDPSSNPRLRKALDEARSANVPKDTIKRAVDKASGPGDGADYVELTYEGFGPAGVGILVDCLTDNRNRAATDVKVAFNKNGGNLGQSGSVSFGFQKKGEFAFVRNKEDGSALTEDELMEVGLDAGLEDIDGSDEGFFVTCAVENYHTLTQAFQGAGLKWVTAGLAQVPENTVEISDGDREKLEKVTDALEDLDDVQNVWTNAA